MEQDYQNTNVKKKHWPRIILIGLVVILIAFIGLIIYAQIYLFGSYISEPDTPSLIIKNKTAISENKDSLSTGYYNSSWPTEESDPIRSCAVLEGGLPKDLTSNQLQINSAELHLPSWGYSRDSNEIFVIGGSPFALDLFTQAIKNGEAIAQVRNIWKLYNEIPLTGKSYISKINTKTMEKTVLPLNDGKSVDYTGGIVMHANGLIYTVTRSHLYKIDPVTMKVLKSIDLPLAGNTTTNFFTIYNGLLALDNGKLVMKGFHFFNPGEIEGYILVVDPETLQIDIQQKTAVSTARLVVYDNYLYHVNDIESIRFKITDEGFVKDENYTAAYRKSDSKNSGATSPMIFPKIDLEVFSDNVDPYTSSPTKLYTQSLSNGAKINSAPAFDTKKVGYNFFEVVGDIYKNNIVIYNDPINNLVAANNVYADGRVELLWQVENIKASASPAISVESGHVYLDDYKDGNDNFIVLDLMTGAEKARIKLPATLPTVGTIFIGNNNDVFINSTETENEVGFVTRITVNNNNNND